jgi:hypothetical protein
MYFATVVPLRKNHDRHRRELFGDRADVGGGFRSEIRAGLKVRLSKRVSVNDLASLCNEDGAVELASH